eukprot:m.65013 g.65013  ORF g.65013 m.65013 type:complete len:210 (-) comp8136_c0_seq1:114-743(-)
MTTLLTASAAKETLALAGVVVLDVDSTVCTDEGIDKLAEHCGVGEDVKAWTMKAMGGNVTFQESFEARLNIINPTIEQVEDIVREGPSLTPGVKEFVAALMAKGVYVYLVSGGVRRLIDPVASALGIPSENIFSNVLHFTKEGKFSHFDDTQPTSRTGGKTKVMEHLKNTHGKDTIVAMIGDGVTDMEAKPPADLFIGFGGNVVRDKVW